jgi:hypothetical protein
MVAYIYNPSAQEAEAGRSRVQAQPRLHSEIFVAKTEGVWLDKWLKW